MRPSSVWLLVMSTGIWREGLHRILWDRRYGEDLVDVVQARLAEELCITRPALTKVIGRMASEGRLEKVADSTYRLVDPDSVECDG